LGEISIEFKEEQIPSTMIDLKEIRKVFIETITQKEFNFLGEKNQTIIDEVIKKIALGYCLLDDKEPKTETEILICIFVGSQLSYFHSALESFSLSYFSQNPELKQLTVTVGDKPIPYLKSPQKQY
jgi:hypothetical protein